MNADLLFKISNSLALISWLVLIFLPRTYIGTMIIKYGVLSALAFLYSVLAFLYFFKIDGGGFNSIAQVRALFMNDFALVAGWIHYLAFDLFVGLWIIKESEKISLHRFFQGLILFATFMFGPLGLLLFYGCKTMDRAFGDKK